MAYLIRGAKVFFEDHFEKLDILVKDGIISNISSKISDFSGTAVFDMDKHFVFPGLIDVHVHLREPGFFYKETIKSGTMAAARGGFTTVCSMPNLEPVPDSLINLKAQLDIIEKDAAVKVLPFGSISKGQKQLALSDMEELAPYVAGFSDDGFGVQRDEMMLLAMEKAKSLGKIIAAHCEDNSLLGGSAIHDGAYAKKLGIIGISSESEWVQIERDIDLVRKTGCDLHICHISTKEGVELVRKAKAEGLPVSCETAAHYLCLCDEDLRDEGSFRMNPPLRTKNDKEALIKGIQDGTVEIIASDHAPHSYEEKSKGLLGSLNGIVGLETAFPVLYTRLVKTGVLSLEALIKLMHENPAKRFNLASGLSIGQPANLCVFDLDEEYEIRAEDFLSKGKSCPFVGDKVFGKCRLTMFSGKPVYIDEAKAANK